MHRFEDKSLKNILFMSTGALMSPTSSYQGESVPGIAHLLNIKID
jgi:stage V sporulation protein AD